MQIYSHKDREGGKPQQETQRGRGLPEMVLLYFSFLAFLFLLFEEGRIKNSNKLSKQHLQLLGKNIHSNALQKRQLVTLVFSAFLLHTFSNGVQYL